MNSSKKRWRGAIAVMAASTLAVVGLTTIPLAHAADPVVVSPTADTYVQADRPTENFGTSVRWSTEGRANITRNSLIRFNVPAIPADQKVVSAKLSAVSEAAATATEFVDIYTAVGTWTETGVNWGNQPARGATLLDSKGGFANGVRVEWDVTPSIGDGGFIAYKLESAAQKWIGFKSREVIDPTLRPQLTVVTEPKVVTPPPPAPTGDLNDTGFTYGGTWSTGACAGCFQADNHYTNATDATYSQQFTGNKVDLYSEKNSTLGIFAVKIDNGAEVLVDPYSAAGRQDNVKVWGSPLLTEGTHTVTVRNTGTKNAAATGTWFVADRVKAISGATEEEPPPPPPTDGTTAAATLGWGPVVRGDEFNYTGAPDPAKWTTYGDYAGHNGAGMRLQSQSTVNGSAYVVTGDTNGNTGGVTAKFDIGTKYNRVETRMRTNVRDPEYHPVLLLWADEVDGGQVITEVPEIDYAEGTVDTSKIRFFLHWYNSSTTTNAEKVLDTTQWHNYAVEWTSSAVVGYVDGVEWFRDTDPAHIPNVPMHSTMQLDWFPNDTPDANPTTSRMEVDWTRQYAMPAAPPPPPPTGGDYSFGTVGDMNGERTSSTSSASGKNAASIKAALDSGSIENFVGLGDFQYSEGTCNSASDSYYGFWNGLWGGVKAKTFWLGAPNHDWEPGRNTDLGKYMNGECVSTTKSATNTYLGRYHSPDEWYSFDKGNWHFVMAPTATWRYNPTRAQAMTAEMRTNIQAAKAAGKHIIAAYHDPYFTSNTSSHDREFDVKPWIDMFSDEGVRILLSGSQHNYERSCIVNKSDQCNAASSTMQQFQVSTGGIGLRSFTSSPAYIVKRFSDTWGWLKMTLKADGSYTWQYNPTSGGMQTDSGSRAAG